MAANNRHEVQVLGIPIWTLLGIFLPGYAISYLYFPLLVHVDVDLLGWEDRSEVERLLLGGFLGFILYSLPLGFYIKKWFRYYETTIQPLSDLLARHTTNNTSLSDAYVFHNEFVTRLRDGNQVLPVMAYGYFIFAVFLATVLAGYVLMRIPIVIFSELAFDFSEWFRMLFLMGLIVWLAKDAHTSICAHFRSICRLVTLHPEIVKQTLAYIEATGTRYIRPAPGIDYPP